MHILIIEDEAILAMHLQMFLEELGADSCAVATTQAEAVREALDHKPDLIASDVILPQGSGPGAVKMIRSRLGDIPVIYITSREEARLAAPDPPVITKPIRWLALVGGTQDHGLPSPLPAETE
jgi:CheY-like chemotaxis protein